MMNERYEPPAASIDPETAALRARVQVLEKHDRAREEAFAATVHELRTPLTAIRAFAELVLDTPDMDEPQRGEFMRIIIAESERLGRLVNEVLDLAKIEAGQAEWTLSAVDMAGLVADAVRTSEVLFRRRGARVVLDAPAAVRPVRGDRDRLVQVMMNLLSNAARFVPAEGGCVTVSLREDSGSLVVAVKDNGPGVPEADRDTIFEKFRQSGEARMRAQGTGLGLPISRQIVSHLGGRMWLEAGTEGGGATFAFSLPCEPAQGGAP